MTIAELEKFQNARIFGMCRGKIVSILLFLFFVLAKLKKLKKEKILENGDDYEVCRV